MQRPYIVSPVRVCQQSRLFWLIPPSGSIVFFVIVNNLLAFACFLPTFYRGILAAEMP
ncbi:Uncharacterised protein [Serratia fonticola]|jgi:hypothetical protein|nr:Uncharacterised protein [Serratia fonticola]